MTTTFILLIIATTIVLTCSSVVIYYLWKTASDYKELVRKWHKEPCEESLEFALDIVRRYRHNHHPSGEPQLDLATYKISQYLKQLRYNAKNGINIQEQ